MTPTPSRRTVLRATAWTAPAVAVAVAAPAYAASVAATFEPYTEHLANGQARIGAVNLSPTDAVTVSAIVPMSSVTATSRWTSINYAGWEYAGSGTSHVFTATVAPGARGPALTVSWEAVSEDGRFEMTLTAPGQPAVAVVVPWAMPAGVVARRVAPRLWPDTTLYASPPA
ncbi:hypothetical protein ACOACO_13025 [Nocardioides sp. CPCC 205120]|uniref:hypothetical protein n=1 Tax=Nocardioides sp. CPCC 205120 TaxID=3406462 RepID=UPI003B5084A3